MGIRILGAATFAASALAIIGFSHPVQAATVFISGTSFNPGSSFYGTEVSQNNVVNFAPTGSNIPVGYTGLTAPLDGSGWLLGSVSSTISNYQVNWYFLGYEAGNTNEITISSPTYTFTPPGNTNCNICGSSTYDSLVSFATSYGTSPGTIAATFTDTSTNSPPGNGVFINGVTTTALIVAYVDPTFTGSTMTGWALSSSPSDWFAIGFNDNGSGDSDFDDLMVVGQISATPLPSTWIMLLSGFVGLGLIAYRGAKRNATLAAA